jgi:hypothetical protein
MFADQLTPRQRVRLEALARAQAMPMFEDREEAMSGSELRRRIYAVALEIEKFLLEAG